MSATEEMLGRLAEIPDVQVSAGESLAGQTRFGIGGPADIYAQAAREESFLEALRVARSSGLEWTVMGSGTNLIVSDQGFRGIVLRSTADRISRDGDRLSVEAGAELQSLVDFVIVGGLKGLETLAGIPGSVGGAIYGNAGAYGHAIFEVVRRVRFFDGERVRTFENRECEFHYRESIFKRHKEWIILGAELVFEIADGGELRRRADEILAVRNEKYPPALKCAGSIFKNLLLEELPPSVASMAPPQVIREGKVPAAYFLDQAGAKGVSRGDIHVAGYHANLIYNAGAGRAQDLVELIAELKARVRQRFGLKLEEEVQYLGFEKSEVRSQEDRHETRGHCPVSYKLHATSPAEGGQPAGSFAEEHRDTHAFRRAG
jgi:UDP-N-acetylmuramate dehydrogenase